MKEKIFKWGKNWGANISNFNETEDFIWFDMDTNISIKMIRTLEKVTNYELDSVNWHKDCKLQIWLYKEVKGE